MAIIEMPKDATGRWIPLDTKVLYNDRGVEYEVNRFTFGFDVITREGEWTAEFYGTWDICLGVGYLNWREVLDSLADLIDRPTCKIILARELRTAFGKPITGINGYILSCGHQAVGFEKPRYCPECGEEVGE